MIERKAGHFYVADVVNAINETQYVFLATVLRKIDKEKIEQIKFIIDKNNL